MLEWETRSQQVTSHLAQLSLAIPPRVDAVGTNLNWEGWRRSGHLPHTQLCISTGYLNGAIRLAKPQSKRHHQQTNIQLFTGRMPFLSLNQQCHSTEGEMHHIPWTCSAEAHLGSFILVLTTKGS